MVKRLRKLFLVTVFIFSSLGLNQVINVKAEETLWSEEYDASQGTLHNLNTEANGSNYTGDGYVAGWGSDGQYVDLEISVPEDGHYKLTFRYGGGAGDAARYLLIGDSYELDTLIFPGTGDWDNYATAVINSVYLEAGDHTLSLIFDSSKGSDNWLNFDQLIVSEQPADQGINWYEIENMADQAQDSLYKNFWSNNKNVFHVQYPRGWEDNALNYWWQAHALDTLIDGYERTGDQVYLDRASELLDGLIARNGGHITNNFYDDMLWLGLATLRLYEHTNQQTHRDYVFTLWEDIKTGWNDHQGGGIAWKKDQLDYKNTPANAPAVILAARLYQEFSDEEDLEWAKRIFNWQTENLVDPANGFVWDGVNREGDGQIDKGWVFTYNQGVYIGAGLELYRATNDSSFLDAATRTADTTITLFADHNGVIFEEGEGDGGLFKGILVRYLTDLALEDLERTDYIDVVLQSARSAWQQTELEDEILFGSSWLNSPGEQVQLAQQLSGVMLIEQAALLIDTIGLPTSTIVEVGVLEDIIIEAGTEEFDLPKQVNVIADDGLTYVANISWQAQSEPEFDANEPGEYIFTGSISSIEGLQTDEIENLAELVVEQKVIVEPIPVVDTPDDDDGVVDDVDEDEDTDDEDEDGTVLPETSTNAFNFMLIGLVLIASAAVVWLIDRKRKLVS